MTFQATLSPDGQGGHWLEVNQDLRTKAGAKIGQVVAVEMAPLESGEEPEPEVPPDFQKALEASPPRARQAWSDITPLARRDWIQWITSGKRAQTRVSRIEKARDMLASGKRRPCCFDRSGMYDKSLGCPVADDRSSSKRSAGQIGHSLARPTPGNRRMTIHDDILAYNAAQAPEDRRLCDALSRTIDDNLPGAENKIWHGHPVWFLDGNPIAGYSKLKNNVRLLFWSGQSFDEPGLTPEGSFKAAEARYTAEDQVVIKDLKRWLAKSREIQWDYKNIVKRKGRLERLKEAPVRSGEPVRQSG